MGKYFAIFLAVVCFSIPSVFSQENITITTYYPSPAGIFNELMVNQIAVGDVNGDGQINNLDLAHTVDAQGNVMPMNGTLTVATAIGIGTTTPQGELHIRSTDNVNGNANLILEGENPANGASTGTWDINSRGGTPGTPPAGNLQFISTAVDANSNPINPSTTPMTIEQGAPNDSLYVADNGNVGIGTNDPQSKLDVNGGVKLGTEACTAAKAGTLGYDGTQVQVCTPSGWAVLGSYQIVQARLTRTTVKGKIVNTLVVVNGPSDAVKYVNNVGTAKLDGIVCDKSKGWLVTGCFNSNGAAHTSGDNDMALYDTDTENGCLTNDLDQFQGQMTTICIKH